MITTQNTSNFTLKDAEIPFEMPVSSLFDMHVSAQGMATAQVVIDKRERLLARMFKDAQRETLDAGDIMVSYPNGGAWIAERKTADDLAASIRDGRWQELGYFKPRRQRPETKFFLGKHGFKTLFVYVLSNRTNKHGVRTRCPKEQKDRLLKSGFRFFIIVEGDLASAQFTYESLMGAIVNAQLRDGITIFRTWNMLETKALIQDLVKKLEVEKLPAGDILATNKRKWFVFLFWEVLRTPHRSTQTLTHKHKAQPSRKKDSDVRMLTCIPRFSEQIARSILTQFGGSLRDLQAALFNPATFPKILIAPNTYLGKARVSKLVEVLSPPQVDG